MKISPTASLSLSLLLLLVAVSARADDPDGLPWIEDDWEAAVSKAKEADKPLVVKLWAPWCHTCLSMKSYVLPDPAIRALGDRFVWLAMDTDKPENEAALEILRPEVWPTLYVVNPEDVAIEARHAGAASVTVFRELLLRGEKAFVDEREISPEDPLHALRKGDRLAAKKEYAAAEEAWKEAMERAPDDWARTPDVLVRRIRARYRQEAFEDGARFALEHLGRAVAHGDASAGDFAKYASLCAERLDDEALAKRVRLALVADEGSLASALEAKGPMSVDDRSDALATLRKVQGALGRDGAAKRTAKRQAELLDRAVKEAPHAQAEATWAWPRAEVHVFLDRGEEILPWLEALAEKLPEAYDPPYRLAWLLHRLDRHEEALPWAEKAYARAYGPRKARIAVLLETIRTAR